MSEDRHWYFLGYDLRKLFRYFLSGWREFLFEHPAQMKGLLSELVSVQDKIGTVRCFRGDTEIPVSEAKAATLKTRAFLMPDSATLSRVVNLPAEAEPDMEAFVELEVRANSPFLPEETAYGWKILRRSGDVLVIAVCIVSKLALERLLQQNALEPDEIWASYGEGNLIIRGFNESDRQGRYRQRLYMAGAAAAGFVLLLLLLAVVPVGWKYMEMKQAHAAFYQAKVAAEPAVKLRDQLQANNQLIDSVGQLRSASYSTHTELERLAVLLPDDVSLSLVDMKGGKIRMDGLAGNASRLMQQLTDNGAYHEVISPTAIRKDGRSGKERFVVELTPATETGVEQE